MIIGLAQGFIKFGTGAHKVLVALHELGDMRQCDLREETGIAKEQMSMLLLRLTDYQFIYRVGKAAKYVTGEKTQWLYSLQPRKYMIKYKRATGAERQARCRAARDMRAPSVFDFRGRIPLCDQTTGTPAQRK